MLMDSHILTFGQVKSKGKVIPLQAQWPLGFLVGLGSRISRHSAHEGGKVVTLTHRPSLPAGKSWYSFLEAESTPRHVELSDAPEKIPSDRGSIPGPSNQQCSALTTTPPQVPFGQVIKDILWVGQRSRYNGWLRAGRSGHRIPVWDEIFRTCPDRPWGPPSLLQNGYRVFPRGNEWPGRDADTSPRSSAMVMKEQSYTSTPPMGCAACTKPQCLYKGAL